MLSSMLRYVEDMQLTTQSVDKNFKDLESVEASPFAGASIIKDNARLSTSAGSSQS